jgi:hypothetical protein
VLTAKNNGVTMSDAAIGSMTDKRILNPHPEAPRAISVGPRSAIASLPNLAYRRPFALGLAAAGLSRCPGSSLMAGYFL